MRLSFRRPARRHRNIMATRLFPLTLITPEPTNFAIALPLPTTTFPVSAIVGAGVAIAGLMSGIVHLKTGVLVTAGAIAAFEREPRFLNAPAIAGVPGAISGAKSWNVGVPGAIVVVKSWNVLVLGAIAKLTGEIAPLPTEIALLKA